MRTFDLRFLVPAALVLAGCQGAIHVEGALPETLAEGRNATISLGDGLHIHTADNMLVIDRARMMLGEIEIEGRTEASETESGPAVLELGLDGEPTVVAISDVPAGTYRELGFELLRGGHEDAEGSGDFGGDSPASILVDGSLDGAPFEFRSAFAPELEFDLGSLKVRDGETARVTVTFDVAAWFLDEDGDVLDPSDLANAEAIDANIEHSVASFTESEEADDEED